MEPDLFEVADAFSIPKLDIQKYPAMYHYTSPDGLLGILERGAITLWFSRYDFLNDTSEGQDIQKQYDIACKELLKQNIIDNSIFLLIESAEPNDTGPFGFPYNQKTAGDPVAIMSTEQYETFVCCFSAKQDLLPMWNYYIKENHYQGYNFGLNPKMFEDNDYNRRSGFFEKNGYMKINVGKVLYKDEEKQRILQNRIAILCNYYRFTRDSENLKKNLITMLNNLRMLFKDKAFEHEEEIRAFLFRPLSIPEHVNCNYELPQIRYRSQSGVVVPFVSVQFYRYHHYLINITVGPMANQSSATDSIKLMLKEKGYSADVNKSEVPVRY